MLLLDLFYRNPPYMMPPLTDNSQEQYKIERGRLGKRERERERESVCAERGWKRGGE